MVFCDIGNTFLHFFYKGRIWRESPNKLSPKRQDVKIFYISVNPKSEKKLLASHSACVNLAPYFSLNTAYRGMGIDRVAACVGVGDGIIVDAGSAITVDIMQNGVHLGGYILPGLGAFRQLYKTIAPVLSRDFDLAVDLDRLPQNTRSALSYGVIKSILLMIDDSAKGKQIVFTGGDGKFFSRFLSQEHSCVFDETIVFKGMQQAYSNYLTAHKGRV